MEIICYSCGRGENPENSIEGIRHCLKINPDWRIEMDLQLTKDGQIVLFHDFNTIRTTGKDYNIQELNLEFVKKLNCGYNFQIGLEFPYRQKPIEIPTLDDVCHLFPQAKFLLDIHTDNLIAIDKIINIIESNKMENQIVVVSHYDKVKEKFKSKRPDWVYGAATNEAKKMVYSSFLFLDGFFAIKSDILMLPVKYGKVKVLTSRAIRHCKYKKKLLWVWLNEGKKVVTVNSKNELDVLKKLGVNGIFTEFPERLIKEITESNS